MSIERTSGFIILTVETVDLKSLHTTYLRTNILNDVTAAPFLVDFIQLVAEKKPLKTVQL